MTGTDGGEYDKTKSKKKRRIPIGSADGWTAIATIFLVGVGAWGIHKTDIALELSQRAWLSTIGAGFVGPIEKSSSIHFGVNITNSGKEPATDVTIAIQSYEISRFDAGLSSMDDVIVPGKAECGALIPQSGRTSVVPNTIFTEFFDSARSNPAILADDDIINRTKYYATRGCIAYNTFGRTRHAAFCYILINQPARDAANNAAPNTGTPLLIFANCATGFDAD